MRRRATCVEAMDVLTVGATQQLDTVDQCGEFADRGHVGPPSLWQDPRGDAKATVDAAQQVDSVVRCEQCADGRHTGPQGLGGDRQGDAGAHCTLFVVQFLEAVGCVEHGGG